MKLRIYLGFQPRNFWLLVRHSSTEPLDLLWQRSVGWLGSTSKACNMQSMPSNSHAQLDFFFSNLDSRQRMDSRRFEEAVLQYAVLKMASWYQSESLLGLIDYPMCYQVRLQYYSCKSMQVCFTSHNDPVQHAVILCYHHYICMVTTLLEATCWTLGGNLFNIFLPLGTLFSLDICSKLMHMFSSDNRVLNSKLMFIVIDVSHQLLQGR